MVAITANTATASQISFVDGLYQALMIDTGCKNVI
jgi:hypothetical protein